MIDRWGRTPHRVRQLRWPLAMVAACGIGAAVGLVAVGGPREVRDTGIIRSAQPSPEKLRETIRRFNLATVVNLRDAPDDREWLCDERAVCARAGVAHHTIRGLEPHGWPPQASVRHLVELLDTAERPLLLHCYRGVDRTGWAAAVAAALDGAPLADAVGQLSLRRGHACWPPSCPPHLFFTSYVRFLEADGAEHSGQLFREWTLTDYAPDPYHAEIELVDPLPASVGVGDRMLLRARVANLGADGWRLDDGDGSIRLGVRAVGPVDQVPSDPPEVFRDRGTRKLELGRSKRSAGVVEAGAQRVFEIRARVPQRPGRYLLQIDMLHERVRWFSDLGGPGAIVVVDVRLKE